ncbi:MAG: MGMT family protein [Tepidisphaeraceae bacterium]|jgi:methylated-DNA-[protein]-cysteine S-methyltransferase
MTDATVELETQIRRGRIVPGMSFAQKVWAVTARIPRGRVATYADLARSLKSTAYRAVGQALHRNPYAPGVPCHRVVGSDGRLTGYAKGLPAKKRLLEEEGIFFLGSRVDLARCREYPVR